MKKSQFTKEKIVQVLRDADATTTVAAARKHGVSEQSIYRWRKQYGGMGVSDVRELEKKSMAIAVQCCFFICSMTRDRIMAWRPAPCLALAGNRRCFRAVSQRAL
jgi:Transposase